MSTPDPAPANDSTRNMLTDDEDTMMAALLDALKLRPVFNLTQGPTSIPEVQRRIAAQTGVEVTRDQVRWAWALVANQLNLDVELSRSRRAGWWTTIRKPVAA